MTGMDDLVAWLRARLDHDERVAQEVLSLESDDFEYEYSWSRRSRHKDSGGSGSMSLPGAPTPRERLAEVGAKRRILELHAPDTSRYVQPQCHECSGCGCCSVDWPCHTVKLVALPYAERDGYCEEWRP